MVWAWNQLTAGSTTDGLPLQKVDGYPDYEAQYLRKALQYADRKYDSTTLLHPDGERDDVAREVYLSHVTKDYKKEADAALKQEFALWLDGAHPANEGNNEYKNGEGRVTRRWTFQSDGDGAQVGAQRDGWRHTPWGKSSLGHLPGVRDYLRKSAQEYLGREMELNLLADYGPQDLQSAWTYFTTFVKGKPSSEAISMVVPRDDGRAMEHRALIADRMPEKMREADMEQHQGVVPVDTLPKSTRYLPSHAARDAVAKVAEHASPVDENADDMARAVRSARELRAQGDSVAPALRDVEKVAMQQIDSRRQELVQNAQREKLAKDMAAANSSNRTNVPTELSMTLEEAFNVVAELRREDNAPP